MAAITRESAIVGPENSFLRCQFPSVDSVESRRPVPLQPQALECGDRSRRFGFHVAKTLLSLHNPPTPLARPVKHTDNARDSHVQSRPLLDPESIECPSSPVPMVVLPAGS